MNLSSRVMAGNYMDGLNFQESTCKQMLLGFRATDVRWYDPGCAPASLTARIERLTLCTMDGMKFAVISWNVRFKASSQAGWWVERCQRDGSLVTHNQMSYSRAMTWHLSAVLVPSLHGKPRELTKEVFSISGDGLPVMEKTMPWGWWLEREMSLRHLKTWLSVWGRLGGDYSLLEEEHRFESS